MSIGNIMKKYKLKNWKKKEKVKYRDKKKNRKETQEIDILGMKRSSR
jgi:hypothetical protein